MGSNIAAPAPSDFAEVAVNLSHGQIGAHYGFGVDRARRLVAKMPAEWQAQRKAGEAARNRVISQANVAKALNARIAQHYADRAARGIAVPLDATKRDTPMPADFVAMALVMTQKQLALHYRRGSTAISNWLAALPEADRLAIAAAVKARRQVLAMQVIDKARAAFVAKCAKRRAEKPKREPRRKKVNGKAPGSASGVNWGFRKPVDIAPAQGGYAAMAAQYLRRFYVPVVRGDVLHKALTGFYQVGAMRLTEAEMTVLARRKGWNPEAWKQVAA